MIMLQELAGQACKDGKGVKILLALPAKTVLSLFACASRVEGYVPKPT